MRQFAVALIGAVFSAAYWWLVVTVNYGLFGGDVRPGVAVPSEATTVTQNAVTLIVAVPIYALLSIGWARLTAGCRGFRRGLAGDRSSRG